VYSSTVKRKTMYEGAVQGFVVETGGRLGAAAKKFIDEVVPECEMSDAVRGGEEMRALLPKPASKY
jgi:hypothetical protein